MATTSSRLNLTDFMEKARVWLVVGVIFLVLIIVFQIASSYLRKEFPNVMPVAMPRPDYAFDRLPAVRFSAKEVAVRPTSYTLMVEGVSSNGKSGWPTFGNRGVIEVYKVQPATFSLTADQKIREIARNLGFMDSPLFLDDRTYLFSRLGRVLEENLQMDSKTLYMQLTTNYLATSNYFGVINARGEKSVPDRMAAINAVKNYLQRAGTLPSALSDQMAEVQYVTNVGNSLRLAQSALEADYVTVSLPRSPLFGQRNGEATNYGFYGPDNISSVYGIVGRNINGEDVVVALENYYSSLDLSQVGTYVLRSVAEAWQEVQKGQAYVINPRGVSEAAITSVELGYYESHSDQEYILPIYFFRGNNDVLIYTQALSENQLR